MESVEQLSLVLMDALHVAVKHGLHVDRDVVLLQVLCELAFVVLMCEHMRA